MNVSMKNYLSSNDLLALLTLSHRSLGCRDLETFKKLVLELGALIGFERALCGRAKLPDLFLDPGVRIDYLDISYPPGYMDTYFNNRLHLTDVNICAFLSNLEPINLKTLNQKFNPLYPAAALAHDFGMFDGWNYGVVDIGTMQGIQLTLGGDTAEDTPIRTRLIVEYAIPFLAEAYRRILDGQRRSTVRLTPREIEVLQWIKEGKSSWEISMILRCSRRVVDFHAENIRKKLNCTTRVQAVVAALQYGLLKF